jgi:hypothetical protein
MTDVVTLNQIREWLQFSDSFTGHDNLLSDLFIPAATAVINRECDDVIPITYDEYYDGGDYSIWLRHTPILSVQLVEEGWGFTNYALTEIEVNSESMPTMFAFSIDLPDSGKISRRSGGNVNIPFISGESNVHVIYQTGFADIPGGVQMVALQMIQYWYRGFIQDQAANDPYATLDTDFPHSGNDIYTPQNQGVPEALIEALKPWRRGPIIG